MKKECPCTDCGAARYGLCLDCEHRAVKPSPEKLAHEKMVARLAGDYPN